MSLVYPDADVKKDTLLINCGSASRPTYFPVNLCDVLIGQPFKGVITPEQREAMVEMTSADPVDKKGAICQQGADILGLQDDIEGPVSDT